MENELLVIKDSISTEEKFDIIDLSLKEATLDGMLNSAVLHVLFIVNMVLAYTNADFPEDLGNNKIRFYDHIVSNGILEQFYNSVDAEELNTLETYFDTWTDDYRSYLFSGRGIVQLIKETILSLSGDTANNIEALKELNLSDLKELLPLAQGLGINLDNAKS